MAESSETGRPRFQGAWHTSRVSTPQRRVPDFPGAHPGEATEQVDGERITEESPRAEMATWFRSPEARDRANEELRHLGLPTILADDLLATATYEMARWLQGRDDSPTAADPFGPAHRALATAARALLRLRRRAHDEPLASEEAPIGTRAVPPDGPTEAVEWPRLRANPAVTDRRRRIIASLSPGAPDDRAAALTALTLATDPTVRPPATMHLPLDLDGIDRVRALLEQALAIDGAITGGNAILPDVVDRGVGPDEPPLDDSPSTPSTGVVHPRTAHG